MYDPEQAPCSLVYPLKWDAVTADEQMMWFLARLSAQLDSIRSEFAAARTGDPAGATSRVDPATSPAATTTATSTTASAVLHTNHDTTAHAAVAGTDEYAIVAASAEVAPELVVLPSVFSLTIKVQEVLEITHHASLDFIATTPVSCSTKCPNQVIVTPSLASPVTTAPLLPATIPVLITNLIHPATNGQQGLLIRLTPWPSFQMHLADGNEVRPVPWPSLACYLEGMTPNYKGLLPQSEDNAGNGECELEFSEWKLSISTELQLQGHYIPGVDRELRPKAWPLFKFSHGKT